MQKQALVSESNTAFLLNFEELHVDLGIVLHGVLEILDFMVDELLSSGFVKVNWQILCFIDFVFVNLKDFLCEIVIPPIFGSKLLKNRFWGCCFVLDRSLWGFRWQRVVPWLRTGKGGRCTSSSARSKRCTFAAKQWRGRSQWSQCVRYL